MFACLFKREIDNCLDCGGELDTGWECNDCGKDWRFMVKADIASSDLTVAGAKNPEQGSGYKRVFALPRKKPLPKRLPQK